MAYFTKYYKLAQDNLDDLEKFSELNEENSNYYYLLFCCKYNQ